MPAKKNSSMMVTHTNEDWPKDVIFVDSVYHTLEHFLGKKFQNYTLRLWVNKRRLDSYIPNFFRIDSTRFKRSRMPNNEGPVTPIVRNMSKPWQPEAGLISRGIALWPSHGWYYDYGKKRWDWQRARVFQTIEDLLPLSFTQPYLVPMLENAGANVFLPRERDLQVNEIIVDESEALASGQWSTGPTGFAPSSSPLAAGINPFKLGTTLLTETDSIKSATLIYTPTIPQKGSYAVTIAYSADSTRSAAVEYIVNHAGGSTRFLVNQQIGGSTWIYLGTFLFEAGKATKSGSVLLSNHSKPGQTISADAVRFGGGMGSVARNGHVSGRPRFVEGARYYMQYAGMPDTLVYNVTENPEGDYKDDYRGRGEWVNYLRGAPFGPNKNTQTTGLGIPIDASLAFHTDAGTTRNGNVVGTLMIYSSTGGDSTDLFGNGMSRMANRDFGDLLQTQIAYDIRSLYNHLWKRRSLWDSRYSEAFRPNVPSVLLELLSHHNFEDMKYALDPRFRFDASRAIYKGLLKFIATQYQQPYVVQPLPVTHFHATFQDNGTISLGWRPQDDPLEESATADAFILYTRVEDGGWDNGILVDQSSIILNKLADNSIYSFKVTAVNSGGESFPSEILAVCQTEPSSEPVLIINGFDRISGPDVIEEGKVLGFADVQDQGVPDRYDLNYSGAQINFNADSKWTHNDSPGHGASFSDFETKVIPGNTFDFPYQHGLSIRAAGFSFVSSSDEAIEDSLVALNTYPVVDLILGEERRQQLHYKNIDYPHGLRALLLRSPHYSQAKLDSLENLMSVILMTKADQKDSKTTERLEQKLDEMINFSPAQFEAFSHEMRGRITAYLHSGGNMFISGAHVGTDLFAGKPKGHPKRKFGRSILKMNGRTNHASRNGVVIGSSELFAPKFQLSFNTDYHPELYTVEAPDGLENADSTSITVLRYQENNLGAAIAHDGAYRVMVCGFPFESIIEREQRDDFMQRILGFLKGEKK
ncbi:MAG: fibronectin type III domain-containing protein [Calditrichia bacterium]